MSKKLKIIINSIIALIILITALFFCYKKGLLDFSKIENIKVKEEKVTDEKIKEELSKKITILNEIKTAWFDTKEPSSFKSFIYSPNYQKSYLDEPTKIGISLEAIINLDKIDSEKFSEEEYYEACNSRDINYKIGTKYSYDLVNELYKSLFNSDIKDPSSINGSYIYSYSDKYKAFYTIGYEKYQSDEFSETYIYDYKVAKNEYFVYVAYATITPGTNDTFAIYKDYNQKQLYHEGPGFRLDESNYQEFDKYKLTFIKENNNYIFNRIEKLK